MGILPSSQSYGKIMYMDPLEAGCTVWVNIGSSLSCVIALGVRGVGMPCNRSCFQTRGYIHPSHWIAPGHLSFLK